jgi:hypothetical protein
MWELLTELFKAYGLLAVVEAVQVLLVVYLFRFINRKEAEKNILQEKLLELSEKRLEDAKEEREDYEELARNLERSIDLLIKVFRKRNGNEE